MKLWGRAVLRFAVLMISTPPPFQLLKYFVSILSDASGMETFSFIHDGSLRIAVVSLFNLYNVFSVIIVQNLSSESILLSLR